MDPANSPRAVDADVFRAFEQRLERARMSEGTPGINAAALIDRSVVWRHAVGSATMEPDRPLTPAHTHQIGSITKLFTAHAILILRDEGRLGLDDPVATYIPEFSMPGAEGITLRHVLCHGGGIPTNGGTNAWVASVFPDRAQFRDIIREMPVVQEPMTAAKYSNAGYSMLGLIIDAVSGRSYERFIQERLLDPMGMSHTSFDPSADRAAPFAPGHVVRPHDTTYERAPHHELKAWNACGMLVSTPEDTLQIARLQWDSGGLMAPSTLDEMREVQLFDLHEGASGGDWKLGYGLGWRLVRHGDAVYAGHGGGYVGNRCQLAVSPRDRVAVAVFANGNQALGTTDLAYWLLTELVRSLPPVMPLHLVADAELRETSRTLVGHYFARYWHGVHIVWRDGLLVLIYDTDPANPVSLVSIGDGRYTIGAGRDAGEELVVTRRSNSWVREVHIAGMTYERI